MRVLSVKAAGGDQFGAPFVAVTLDIPRTDSYAISVDAVGGPDQGSIQMLENDLPVGERADLFAEARQMISKKPGALRLRQGLNPVFLRIVPRDSASKITGLDLIRIVCERERE